MFPQHHRLWVRLHEKGGKYLEMLRHHNLAIYLKEYLEAGGIVYDPKAPLFRRLNGGRKPETQELTRICKEVLGIRLHFWFGLGARIFGLSTMENRRNGVSKLIYYLP